MIVDYSYISWLVYIYAYVYIHVMGSQLPGCLICVRTYGWLYACMYGYACVCVCVPYFAHMLFEVVCKHTSVAS